MILVFESDINTSLNPLDFKFSCFKVSIDYMLQKRVFQNIISVVRAALIRTQRDGNLFHRFHDGDGFPSAGRSEDEEWSGTRRTGEDVFDG